MYIYVTQRNEKRTICTYRYVLFKKSIFIKKTSHQNIRIMNFRCFEKQVKVNENIYSLTYTTCSIYIYI